MRSTFKLSWLLEFTGIPRSTFYYQLNRFSQSDKYNEEQDVIKQIYHENKGTYGYRRITMEMHNRGYKTNHKTVLKLMHKSGITCQIRRHKYHSYKGEVGKVASNLLKRDFYAKKPNQKWVTDITQFSLLGEKVYLSPLLDLYNGEIISYNISKSPNFTQINDMLDKAFDKIPNNTNLILHSDQGWQYQMKHYQWRLERKGIIQSMSRKGNCLDNSVMENFFGLLKTEMFYDHNFNSISQFIEELEKYIDYYNNKRIKCKLKGMSPVQFRTHSSKIA